MTTTTTQVQQSSKASINVRRKLAAERQVAREKLSPSQQLAVLDTRLGVGVGAVKERARLQRLISVKTEKVTEAIKVAMSAEEPNGPIATPGPKAQKKGSKKKFKQQ